MEDTLILIVSFAVLIVAGYSVKTIFVDMRRQRSLNADFLEYRSFREAPEERERIKEIIVDRDVRTALGKAVSPSKKMFKLVDCYKTTERGKEIFFLTISRFGQPKAMIESVFFLAPLEKQKKDPFCVRLWSNSYGPGSFIYKSKKRIHALDFGKRAKMNGRDLFRSEDLPDFEQVDFYGPTREHPEHYLGSDLLEMVRYGRENGIAEISCLEGLALFRVYSLTGTQKPGNVLTNPEKPYQYLLSHL